MSAKYQLSRQDRLDQIKHVHNYFGLRLSKTEVPLDEPRVESNKQPVIISVDVEAYERDNSIVTEVGISTLDTADLVNLPAGEHGEKWTPSIRSRHFLIKGREHLFNHKYLHGNPLDFRFGHSEVLDISDIANVIDNCFEPPYSANKVYGDSTFITAQAPPQLPTQRNIIVIGHDVKADIKYLRKLGSSVFKKPASLDPEKPKTRQLNHPSILETLDTAILYQTITSEENTKSLRSLCYTLDVNAFSLHNAGNDARYTLECFVRFAVRSRRLEDGEIKRMDVNFEESVNPTGQGDAQPTDGADAGAAEYYNSEDDESYFHF